MKVIAAMNMTLDGFCDNTLVVVTEELHKHYRDLLENAGVALYGRTTYQLMEYWPTVLKNPTGNTSDYEFAVAIDKVPKVVFSRTLKNLDWHSARLATGAFRKRWVHSNNKQRKKFTSAARA
jgi:dihydrofolate reductase